MDFVLRFLIKVFIKSIFLEHPCKMDQVDTLHVDR